MSLHISAYSEHTLAWFVPNFHQILQLKQGKFKLPMSLWDMQEILF